ncbi:hypothetical protein B0A48_02319 [Cryoendolithus antarcticus]|uniref:IBR domain-containing protein n=1 Tax=Cryoendolithus antarcticus TaxID=1507870 RepID=A0A1V8TNA5_9PEZI|nr:hypothetical protein B0A48_02319 [Cryoendolithus antarcticus]
MVIAVDEAKEIHDCSAGEQEKSIRDYLDSIPEELRWLSQRCYRCRVIVEKTEACNHMRCFCGAEFCLLCGGKWNGIEACGNGCRKVGHDIWDPQDDGGGNEDYDDDDYEDRFDDFGMDPDGYDRDGFDYLGFDRDGFNVEGRDTDGYDWYGWDREGFDHNRMSFTGLAYNDYDVVGYSDDEDDDSWLESTDGYNPWGYDSHGYDANGIDRTGRDREGFDGESRDREGFDREGRDGQGRDHRGYDANGYNYYGWNQHHRNVDNEIRPGWQLTGDGNDRVRARIPFPGDDDFGLDDLFTVENHETTFYIAEMFALIQGEQSLSEEDVMVQGGAGMVEED